MEPVAAGAAEASPFVELGSSGLRRNAGYVDEEFLKELKGAKGAAMYDEMAENDPTCGAALFVIEMLCRQAAFDVEPASGAPEDLEAADFLKSCLSDMSHTWEDGLTETLTMLRHGWAYLELVYKVRDGVSRDPSRRSKHADGRIGWRKVALRGQRTLQDWVFDDAGGVQAMRQSAPPDYQIRTIPIEKALLFRPKVERQNPEGRSILRSAYTSYYYRKHFMRIWGIGIERDLNGIPVAWVPPEMLGTNATAEMQTNLTAIKKIVTQIRNDEQAGVTFPLAYNDQGLKKYDLTLMATLGRRNFDLVAAMRYLDAKIAQTVLADLILIGHEQTGSYALMSEKVDLFSQALDAWLDSIVEVWNRHAIPRLFALNSFRATSLPRLTHGKVARVKLAEVAGLITALNQAGAPLFPDPELQGHLYRMADLPVMQGETTEVGKSAGWRQTLGQAAAGHNPDLFVDAIHELREAIAKGLEAA